jgi:hypothetical protein
MMEELRSSETSVLTRATWRNIPDDGVLRKQIQFPKLCVFCYLAFRTKQKKTPWPLVRKRSIPTERPPLIDEI